MIRIIDLERINKAYEADFKARLNDFLKNAHYINGIETKGFEDRFAHFIGVDYASGVGNGLDAIRLIFEAYKIMGKLNTGDEVLVPANTYVASFLGISQAGLIPVPVDVHPDTMNVNPVLAELLISEKTKAVMPVHLYGQTADMEGIYHLSSKYNLLIIEDAAQAHGAKYQTKMAGNLGNAAAFSFYPTKNLGALGDGGMVTSNDKELIELVNILKNYGQKKKYISEYKGINSRLDEIQSTFLNIKLPFLHEINKKRKKHAAYYIKHINNPKIEVPVIDLQADHVFHQFVLQINGNRDLFIEYMKTQGIECLIHYPQASYLQPAYKELSTTFAPSTKFLSRRIVSIPIHEALTNKEIEYITEKINLF